MGLTEPVFLVVVVAAIIAVIKLLPLFTFKKNNLDYNNFNIKYSNAFFHYYGRGGNGFQNKKQSKALVDHGNYKATFFLEGIPNPITDVNINPDDPEKDYRILPTNDLLAGTRVDILLRKDANGIRYDWANVAVEDMISYQNRLKEDVKSKIVSEKIEDRALEEIMKGEGFNPSSSNDSQTDR